MDWIKQNKFLAGFLGVTIVGAGAIGYLALSSKTAYETAVGEYEGKVQELKGLQGQQPYPDDESVKKMQELQKSHQAAIDALQKQVLAAEIPLKPTTPEKFQDNLRESVRRITAKAQEKNVEVPKDKFYMGYEKYQATPPRPEAAAHLQQMLEAMELAMTILVDNGITAITADIRPDLLPEEATAAPEKDPKKDKDKDKDKGKSLVSRDGFEVEFTGPEHGLRALINNLTSNTQQVFVAKKVTVLNEQEKGPSRVDLNASAPAAPGATAPEKQKQYIVGTEKLKVVARFEVVHFAPAAETAAK